MPICWYKNYILIGLCSYFPRWRIFKKKHILHIQDLAVYANTQFAFSLYIYKGKVYCSAHF